MRVAIVTESFPPDINGVAHCTLQTADHLYRRGHHPLVIAPAGPPGGPPPAAAGGPPESQGEFDRSHPYPVVRIPSLPLPGYPQVRVALPSRKLAASITSHHSDVVHLASPFVLGARGMTAALRLRIPAVAVYQTDLGSYARTYLGAGENAAWRRIRAVHTAADRTLAPSTAAARDLDEHGVPRIRLWPRGVDTERFHPSRRDPELRRSLAPGGELIVGYIGRLAPEKNVELLAPLSKLPGVQVVVVGDGPSDPALRTAMPTARFLGRRTGNDLARIFASLDVFAHTGPQETFCQTVQEAQASGVPVIAPAAGGPLDLVDHGRTGLLVPPGDATEVTDAVSLLAADAKLRAAMGHAGREAVEGRTWEAIGDQLIDHYTEVLAARTAVAA
ncbi:glycosyltransferase family 4 protein [Streptomyces malaysiensis]|uniref:Glycosyl transferase family 1 n=1 Tax=Streptomyces autolyticus TaxID=75293 RepID=A0ABN4W1Q2_9ACTN|nr:MULTISPECIES: glycosyltransferase family 1 protein [Streptomyces]AQA10340.1 glycosyl transferase family 1 [Streptomyces autolyticus]AUA15674.1 GDP-mannose-dependent alpha-mannosyltransferase [Streptomyces sp. M56]MCC4320925.1 glycosyltransferase family 1 protein [Streptomyces malaysiensis]MYX55265.1 glycosyltransferase [Streptomyces sp. SID8382]WPB94926.1 glycosyltransferase family 1 protein [Streptomyces malaysiensis]